MIYLINDTTSSIALTLKEKTTIAEKDVVYTLHLTNTVNNQSSSIELVDTSVYKDRYNLFSVITSGSLTGFYDYGVYARSGSMATASISGSELVESGKCMIKLDTQTTNIYSPDQNIITYNG
jgi:outer membrane lipoprotein-sorting protein